MGVLLASSFICYCCAPVAAARRRPEAGGAALGNQALHRSPLCAPLREELLDHCIVKVQLRNGRRHRETRVVGLGWNRSAAGLPARLGAHWRGVAKAAWPQARMVGTPCR